MFRTTPSKLCMRLTHKACPSFGCEGLLRKESRAESQMPHRSCFHLQSSQIGGRAEGVCYQRVSSPGCCHIFPLCHGELFERIPWQINKKVPWMMLLCTLSMLHKTMWMLIRSPLQKRVYKYTHVYITICFEKFYTLTKHQVVALLQLERVLFRTECHSKHFVKSRSH